MQERLWSRRGIQEGKKRRFPGGGAPWGSQTIARRGDGKRSSSKEGGKGMSVHSTHRMSRESRKDVLGDNRLLLPCSLVIVMLFLSSLD